MPLDPASLETGARFEWSRLITEADIERFAELSGDRGAHHLERDARGRLLAHGLLTATLPTKLGGDMDYIARTMHFEFLRPVYSGDALTCKGRVESIAAQSSRYRLRLSFEVFNQEGELVLKGSSSGMILRK